LPGDGRGKSTQSLRELLLDLQRRGLEVAPKLAVGDGAMSFWAALHEVYGQTRVQRRCPLGDKIACRVTGSQDGKRADRDAQIGAAEGQDNFERHLPSQARKHALPVARHCMFTCPSIRIGQAGYSPHFR